MPTQFQLCGDEEDFISYFGYTFIEEQFMHDNHVQLALLYTYLPEDYVYQ